MVNDSLLIADALYIIEEIWHVKKYPDANDRISKAVPGTLIMYIIMFELQASSARIELCLSNFATTQFVINRLDLGTMAV
jgi:hypothetical protein